MTDSIIDGTNIDTSVFAYSVPKAHGPGKVVNLINKHYRESLTLSTPLILTWGAQEGVEIKPDGSKIPTGKWTLALQFPNSEYSNSGAEDFLASMKALQTKIKSDAITKSMEWFGKEIKSAEVIDEKFNPMLKYPKKEKGKAELDESKAPTLTVKIPQWSGVWKSEIYDEDGNPLYINGKVNSHLSPLEFLKPKSQVICLIQCGGLWFVNGKISITWNLKQAIVQKPKATMEGTCFLRINPTDKAKMKALPPPEDDIDPDGGNVTLVDDSDDEDDSPAPAPAPVSKPVPKPVVVEEPAVIKVVEEPAVVVVEESLVEEVKPKKKIIRKKTDA
jgi:hypothetical protein